MTETTGAIQSDILRLLATEPRPVRDLIAFICAEPGAVVYATHLLIAHGKIEWLPDRRLQLKRTETQKFSD